MVRRGLDMALLTLSRGQLAYGHVALLDAVDFALDAKERVGLIGRNGTGKSSLLRVLAGATALDEGQRWVAPGLRIALVAQEPDLAGDDTVFAAVAKGLAATGELLTRYHDALAELARGDGDGACAERIDALQTALDANDGWALDRRVEAVMSRLRLPPDARVRDLSGGWTRRVALGQALVAQPEVLLLDEPTNHLDLEAIEWLEELLRDFAAAAVFVTHDRRFLDAVATRIVELDRGVLTSYPGSFGAYQTRKAQALADEATAAAKFDRMLADEEVWIRKGVEARRTRNEGRVRRLEALRVERSLRRERLARVNLAIDASSRSGKLVAELAHVDKRFGDRIVIRDFSARILRGDRVGLIGPNGAGKTTLLKLILGELEPDAGTVRRGTNLEVAYFDQLRAQLDPEATVLDTINPGAEYVQIGAERKHVMTYLADFLFAPERARSPVRSLSGGERNRLLLARLFAQPANVLVLDEPTNDLDIETLELLEALLQDYPGTLFLVSHDRAFLDNVVTQTIAFEGDGLLREYVGGYSDWAAYRARQDATAVARPAPRAAGTGAPPARKRAVAALTFAEERELGALPGRIDTMEAELDALRARFADPALYRRPAGEVAALRSELAAAEAALAAAHGRWEALESRRSAPAS
jgi:ATP-binding cassette subfamily F protein uup